MYSTLINAISIFLILMCRIILYIYYYFFFTFSKYFVSSYYTFSQPSLRAGRRRATIFSSFITDNQKFFNPLSLNPACVL
ncbi:Unknown protein, partial [Striga hermonthica]